MIETLIWKGFTYTVKPFTLDTWYGYCEDIHAAKESGRIMRGAFEAACNNLLIGANKEAQTFLSTGLLAKSVLSSEDAKSATAFKGRLDFLSQSFAKQATEPEESETDSTVPSVEKALKPLRQTRKVTKAEPAHSG